MITTSRHLKHYIFLCNSTKSSLPIPHFSIIQSRLHIYYVSESMKLSTSHSRICFTCFSFFLCCGAIRVKLLYYSTAANKMQCGCVLNRLEYTIAHNNQTKTVFIGFSYSSFSFLSIKETHKENVDFNSIRNIPISEK